jgi:hypothetical protein
MKKFEQLHITDQMVILARVIGMLADGGHKSIEEIAKAREQTILDIWRDICAEAGIDECVPWRGFSGPPKYCRWRPAERGSEPSAPPACAMDAAIVSPTLPPS